jgi:hypothetical protein
MSDQPTQTTAPRERKDPWFVCRAAEDELMAMDRAREMSRDELLSEVEKLRTAIRLHERKQRYTVLSTIADVELYGVLS